MTNCANYSGNVNFDAHGYAGADKFGAFYRPISATYDPVAGMTKIQYMPVPMSEMGQRYPHKIDEAIERARIAALFGGALS